MSVGDGGYPMGKPLLYPSCRGPGPGFHAHHARRLPFPDFHDNSVGAAHRAMMAIDQLFIEYFANHVHDQPPNFCKGIATAASTNARAITEITTALPIQPFVCYPTYS